MYGQHYQNDKNTGYWGERVGHQTPDTRIRQPVYVESARYYKKYSGNVTRVAPAYGEEAHPVFDCLRPMIVLMRGLGIFPIGFDSSGDYNIRLAYGAYSAGVFLFFAACVGYMKWDHVEIVKSAEGKFEEAVIDYLFSVYFLPLIMVPISWSESKKMTVVFNDWIIFENYYKKVSGKTLSIAHGNMPLLITLVIPIISCSSMVVTHITMAYFQILKVVPYCYINTITYALGGMWYLHCYVIAEVATKVAEEFEQTLKHMGPSLKIAQYRNMWMLISKVTRGVGNGYCFQLTFLCLYLFLIITLTIYGLLSQIQAGFGIKDVGLTVTAFFAIALLYFICDQAHFASNSVRDNFQKKLLLVELTWMNEDSQQEINMFLKATEMNCTDMSLGGLFDVNRNLFKSLLATMVTYLVVLLQFQISIPEDSTYPDVNSTTSLLATVVDLTTTSMNLL